MSGADAEAEDARRPAPDRGTVWRLLGAPDDQQGSVNDPRSHEEHGLRWNEKWIYLDGSGARPRRLVLWYRYDLVGVLEIRPDGTAVAEPWPES